MDHTGDCHTAHVITISCARCGGTAATLLVTDGTTDVALAAVVGGEPIVWRADGKPLLRFEFLGVTVSAAPPRLVELLTGRDHVDSAALRAVDPDLATFRCRRCELDYCSQCWSTWIEFDDGYYDETRGRCPEGHEQMLDD